MYVWNDKARFMILRVKLKDYRRLAIPVSMWVVDQLLEAAADLTRAGEAVIRVIPLPRVSEDEKARRALRYLKSTSPSELIEGIRLVLRDMRRRRGSTLVDLAFNDIEVEVRLK